MDIQDDDMKFYSLMVEKGQKEISSLLRDLISLSKEKKDDAVAGLLAKHSAAIEGFANAIKALPKPEVKVESNHNEVVKSLNEMGGSILKALADLKNELCKEEPKKEWEFKVTRNYGGYIDLIKGKQV